MAVNIIMFSKIIVILVLGELTTCSMGAPYENGNKQSPASDQSPFNIGLNILSRQVIRAHENINQFKKVLTPLSILHQNKNNNKQLIYKKSDEMLTPPKVKSCGLVSSCGNDNYKKLDDEQEKAFANKESKQITDNGNDVNSKQSDIKGTQIETTTEILQTIVEKGDLKKNTDRQLLDYIFNINQEDIYSTTPDSTENVDYTTGTGDYDFTTTDDLLRIPAPVVATLLG